MLCFEERVSNASTRSKQSRFSDIIAFDPSTNDAFIVDLTVRYETNDAEEDSKISIEKANDLRTLYTVLRRKIWKKYVVCGSKVVVPLVLNFFKEVKLNCSKLVLEF